MAASLPTAVAARTTSSTVSVSNGRCRILLLSCAVIFVGMHLVQNTKWEQTLMAQAKDKGVKEREEVIAPANFSIPIFYSFEIVNNGDDDDAKQTRANRNRMVTQLAFRQPWHKELYINNDTVLTEPFEKSMRPRLLLPRRDLLTLHSLWEFCQQEENQESIVVHLLSPAAAQKREQELLMTEGALSKHCSPPGADRGQFSTCNVCSTRFSPFPVPHSPSNSWSATCSYVTQLMNPIHFHGKLKQIQEFSPYQPLLSSTADVVPITHSWIYSHPNANPCDLYTDPQFQWTMVNTVNNSSQSSVTLPHNATVPNDIKNDHDASFILQSGPRFPLSQWEDDRSYGPPERADQFHLHERKLEYEKLYPNEWLPSDWWGWRLWDKEGSKKDNSRTTDEIAWRKIPLVSKDDPSVWNASHMVPPLHHCTLGGCRHGDTTVSDASIFLEPYRKDGEPLFGLSHVLEKVEALRPTGKEGHNKICTLWFIGDSLSSDTAQSAVCHLMSYMDYSLTRCRNKRMGGAVYGSDHDYCKNHNLTDPQLENALLRSSASYFDLERPAALGPCSKLRIRRSDGERASQLATEETSLMDDEFGLIMPGWGVHCQTRDCIESYMENELTPLLAAVSLDNYVFLWREHEPQHFGGNPGGVYVHGGNNARCGPVRHNRYDNFRNEVADAFLTSRDLLGDGAGQVRGIVRIFDALKPMWGLQQPTGDCTHYCFSPWRYELNWHATYQALKGR